MVNSLKGVSSRKLRQQMPELSKIYWKGVLWSPSYFASSCGGSPLDVIKQYIEKALFSLCSETTFTLKEPLLLSPQFNRKPFL